MNKRLESRIIYLEQVRKGPTGVNALSDAELDQKIADGVAAVCAQAGLTIADLSTEQLVSIGQSWRPALEDRTRGLISYAVAAKRLREVYESMTQPRPAAPEGD